MKIGFLLCSPDINGGTNVIFEHAGGLQQLGNSVSIITEKPISPKRYSWHKSAPLLTWLDFDQAAAESFDIVIATWWESPYLLHKFKASHYVYFVQSIESRFFEPDDPMNLDLRDHSLGAQRCNNGYFFSLPVITEASWIKEYLARNYNNRPFLVRNGIHKELYKELHPVEQRPKDRLRVLVEGPVDVFHKNVARTIELCTEAGVDEIWLLTPSDIKSFPGVDRVFSKLPFIETPAVYSSCQVLVKLSYVEGMFGPPLEMFHCGGTAVVYDVTGHDEYIVHNENSLVVEKDNEEKAVEYIRELKTNPGLLADLTEKAVQKAEEWPDWKRSSQMFATALEEIIQGPGVHRDYLQNISWVFIEHETLTLESRELQNFAAREKRGPGGSEQEHNFIKSYLYCGDDLLDGSWRYYAGSNRQTVSIKMDMPSAACNIRLDPSVRIGILKLFSLKVVDTDGVVLADFNPENGFDKLFLTGTATWIKKGKRFWIAESFGNDPQIFIPELPDTKDKTIFLAIDLQEMGFREYLGSTKRSSIRNRG